MSEIMTACVFVGALKHATRLFIDEEENKSSIKEEKDIEDKVHELFMCYLSFWQEYTGLSSFNITSLLAEVPCLTDSFLC